MEERRPSLREIIGNAGDSRGPVVEALALEGINVPPNIVSRWRSGDRSGINTQRRLDGSEVLRADISRKKIDFYVKMLKLGMELRRNRVNSENGSFTSIGLTEEIGDGLGIEPKALRHVIRSMRADVSYEDLFSADSGLVYLVDEAVDDFDYRTRGRKTVPGLSQVIEDWKSSDKAHVADFYKLLYSRGRTSVASWTTYEIPVLHNYFSFRNNNLSRLDERILRSFTRDADKGSLVREIRDTTGVPVDHETLSIHRNLLVDGHPVEHI